MATITLQEMIDCIRREIAMREKSYPRWVKQHKMLQATADREMARMRAVLDFIAHHQVAEFKLTGGNNEQDRHG